MRTLLGWVLAILSVACLAAESGGSPLLVVPPGTYGFRSFGGEHGLTNLSTTSIARDAEGYLWVGTEDGVFRLEGGKFRSFTEKDGLPSVRINTNSMVPGLSRGLWIVTVRGIAFWNGQRFLRPSAMGLQGKDELRGIALNQGGVILSDPKAKTRYLNLDGESFEPLEELPWRKGLWAATYSRERDLLLIASGTDLWAREKGKWSHRDLQKLLPGEIKSLWIDSKGPIWLRCSERIGCMKDLQANPELISLPMRLSSIKTANLGMDSLGRLWTNTTEGLVWIKGAESGFIGDHEGLPQGGALALRVDQSGTVWIGGEGVHKLLGDGLWTGYTRRQNLPSDVVWSISCTRDGHLWAGTGGGLAVSGPKGWQTLPGTRSNQFKAQAEDEDGNLWLGHSPSEERPVGLSVRQPRTMEIRPVRLPGLLPDIEVSSIYAEGKTLWLGTGGAGLIRATRKGIALRPEFVTIGTWPKIDAIKRIQADGKGGIWVGSTSGIAHWDGASWATLDKSGGLVEKEIISLAVMPDGKVWATFRKANALVHVCRTGNQIQLLDTILQPHPLVKTPIATLVGDRNGVLWLNTSSGLLRWDGTRIERYGRHNGFPGEDCTLNGLWFDPNGDVWVGLSVGLVRGRLSLISEPQIPPPAAIHLATQGDGRSILHAQGPVSVPYFGRTLTFGYGPLGSKGTEDITYQVRLLGMEDTWRDTAIPEARYTNLGPGSYRFEVRIMNSVNDLGKTCALEFMVLNPWWKTWWFLTLCVTATVGGVLMTIRWRTLMLLRRTVQLEIQVHERTWELEDANKALAGANKALEEASMLDPLTGLRNRRYLGLSMPEEIARTQRVFRDVLHESKNPDNLQEDMVFFVMDLDHFKQVNDTYGHAAGDLVLKETASVLKTGCRESDTLVRWGGEEFLLIAKRTNRAHADRMAQNLCEAVRNHEFKLSDGTTIRKTISIGYAAFPILESIPDLFDWEESVEIADQCLYAAKYSGRNGFVGVNGSHAGDTQVSRNSLLRSLPTLAAAKGVLQIKTSFSGLEAIRWKDA